MLRTLHFCFCCSFVGLNTNFAADWQNSVVKEVDGSTGGFVKEFNWKGTTLQILWPRDEATPAMIEHVICPAVLRVVKKRVEIELYPGSKDLNPLSGFCEP